MHPLDDDVQTLKQSNLTPHTFFSYYILNKLTSFHSAFSICSAVPKTYWFTLNRLLHLLAISFSNVAKAFSQLGQNFGQKVMWVITNNALKKMKAGKNVPYYEAFWYNKLCFKRRFELTMFKSCRGAFEKGLVGKNACGHQVGDR